MDKMHEYLGDLTRENDFDEYWQKQITLVDRKELNIKRQKTTYTYGHIESEELIFEGLDKTPVYAWYIHTNPISARCIITTHGFKSSRKLPSQYLHWVASGFDVLVFDVRLQQGQTGFLSPIHSSFIDNVLTINLHDKSSYYLYHIYTDAMCAVKVMHELGYQHCCFEGTSQAGGLALAVACLYGHLDTVLANVPSFSDIDHRVQEGTGSFRAITNYLKAYPDQYDAVMKLLSYFDLKNMADRLSIPVYCSVGGKDNVCPARNFLVSYHRFNTRKQLVTYPMNEHEGGGILHTERELNYLGKFYKKTES